MRNKRLFNIGLIVTPIAFIMSFVFAHIAYSLEGPISFFYALWAVLSGIISMVSGITTIEELTKDE